MQGKKINKISPYGWIVFFEDPWINGHDPNYVKDKEESTGDLTLFS